MDNNKHERRLTAFIGNSGLHSTLCLDEDAMEDDFIRYEPSYMESATNNYLKHSR